MITAPRSIEAVIHRPPKPELSLALGVFRWCEANLRQPDGPAAGDPWRFTREQQAFLWRMYAIDDDGRFLWSRAVLRRAKGWGKSPFLAALALAELCGPVRFAGFDDRGHPVGERVSMPWVQLAGVSEKQTNNTMSMVLAMLDGSPLIDEYGIDPGLTRVFVRGGGRLEPITASAPTAEGARPTFVVMDETHHWTASNGGHKLAEVIRRNLGKSRDGAARSIETTNAHALGEDSVAERSYDAWVQQSEGRARRATILYDSREAPADLDLADEPALMQALSATYGDSTWVDLRRIRDEIYDPATPVSEACRFYLNQISATEDAWVTAEEWDLLASAEKQVADGDTIVAFFDGSKSDDATALVGCRVSDGHVFLIGAWEAPEGGSDWSVPVAAVDAAVEAMFDRWDVAAFFADVREWESFVHTSWPARHGDGLVLWAQKAGRAAGPIAWDMRAHVQEFTLAAETTAAEVIEAEFTHDGHPLVRRHVANARRRPNRWGVSVGKESRHSSRKIDAAVCVIGARMVRRLLLASPEWAARSSRSLSGKRAGRVVAWG